MDHFRGLFFDVGVTVFDWKNTSQEKIQKLADDKDDRLPGVFHNESLSPHCETVPYPKA